MKFHVVVEFVVSTEIEVQAASAKAAAAKALNTVSVSLCHHCSQEMNLGDPVRIIVQSEDREKVLLEEDV